MMEVEDTTFNKRSPVSESESSSSSISSFSSTYCSEDGDFVPFTSKSYEYSPDGHEAVSPFPSDVICQEEYHQIMSSSIDKLEKGGNVFPASLVKYMKENNEFVMIYECIKEKAQDGICFAYAPGVLANILKTMPETDAPKSVLCDVCVFSRSCAVTLLTFTQGIHSDRATVYNSQLAKLIKDMQRQITKTDIDLIHWVVGKDVWMDKKEFEKSVSEMELAAKLMSISCTSDIQGDKWQEVIRHFTDQQLPVKLEPMSQNLQDTICAAASNPTKRHFPGTPAEFDIQGKGKRPRTEIRSFNFNAFKIKEYNMDDTVEMRESTCDVTSTTIKEQSKHGGDLKKECEIKNVFNKGKYKVFNDSVHGHIKIHPLCVKIIDTPQFQRLRDIKQLCAVHYVYPGAVHTRFEHSYSTCYLAEKWLKMLVETLSPEVKDLISDQDILCVMIAGLCHDLGQGPYSMALQYDDLKAIGNEMATEEKSLTERSCLMLDHLLKANGLKPHMKVYGLNEESVADIKMMIKGDEPDCVKEDIRMQHRSFLYNIVKNKHTYLDVDTWETLDRDCKHLHISNYFDCGRLMEMSRINFDTDGRSQICFRDKEIENIYKMFETRYDLNRQAYNHRVTYVIKLMTADALLRANGHISLAGQDGMVSLEKCEHDMAAFTNLTDNIVDRIETAEDKDNQLGHSKKIIAKIKRRHFYLSCHTRDIEASSETALRAKIDEECAAKRILEILNKTIHKEEEKISQGDLFVEFLRLAYNKTEADPASHVHYFTKDNPTEITMDTCNETIRLKPRIFQHYRIFVSYRNVGANGTTKEALHEALKKWFEEKKLSVPC